MLQLLAFRRKYFVTIFNDKNWPRKRINLNAMQHPFQARVISNERYSSLHKISRFLYIL